MPPIMQPAELQTTSKKISPIVCILLVIIFSALSAGGVYVFLQKSVLNTVPQAPIVATTPLVTPSAKSAEETALLFVKEVTSTSSKNISARTVPALSLLLHDDMYKTSLLPSATLEGAQATASIVELFQSQTVVSGDTSSVQVQVCYDTNCYKADHYYVTLVIEKGIWAVAGVSSLPESGNKN